jgi:hypothetical protein
MPSNFPNGIASYGIPVLPGLPPTTGSVFFVHSGTGSDGNSGKTPTRPLSTLDAAVGKCTADKGDLIIVMPGHTESITAAGGLDLDVAGITIIGLGAGSLRPTFTFSTAVGADMDVDAANITIRNLLFLGGIDALTGPIDVNAADFTAIDCEYRDSTGQATDVVVADANADRMRLVRWTHRGATAAGADTAITMVGCDDVVIEDPYIDGNFAVAAIENVTTAMANLSIYGGQNRPAYLRTRNAADVIVTLVATTTGNIGPNLQARLNDNAANITEAFVGAAAQFFQPINIVNLDGESSMQTNITASTDA